MRPLARILFVLISLFCLVFVATRFHPRDQPAPVPATDAPDAGSAPASARAHTTAPPDKLSSPATETPRPSSAPAPTPVAAPRTREQILARIEAAYTTYKPESLPLIEPYLDHQDAEIRAAAREAVVQLGATEGAELLRRAARKIRDPREAVEFLDAAAFLELPPAPPPSLTLPAKALPAPGSGVVASGALAPAPRSR